MEVPSIPCVTSTSTTSAAAIPAIQARSWPRSQKVASRWPRQPARRGDALKVDAPFLQDHGDPGPALQAFHAANELDKPGRVSARSLGPDRQLTTLGAPTRLSVVPQMDARR